MYRSVIIIVLLFRCSRAQDANCDFGQNVALGVHYDVRSPNYPNIYTSGSQCRWTAICPNGYNCRMDCSLSLPQSSSCNMDRFLVSKNGDSQMTGSDYYCGQGTLNIVSLAQRLTVALIVSRYSTGGYFRCDLYAQPATTQNCTCGIKKTNRIVNGQETSPNEYPMMAGIIYDGDIQCGGTVISKKTVVTAAHCIIGKLAREVTVKVGVHDKNNSPAAQTRAVESMVPHEQYNGNTNANDIAIVIVTPSFVINIYVSPACLPFPFINQSFQGTQITLLGWGTLFFGGPTSSVLRKVPVDVISQSACQSRVPTVTSSQMCTYTKGKDSCQNDSGGPGLYTDPSTNLEFFVCIISFGRACAGNDPGICTRVTSHLNWILQNAPDNYCRK